MGVQGGAFWIPDYLSKWRVPFEVIPGWENRGKAGGVFRGVVTHHTGVDSTAPAPALNVCVHGREGLRNSLCNVHTDQAAQPRVRVVAAGVAWHAGEGGWRGLTGNPSVLGNEVEGTTGKLMAPAQRELVVLTTAALLDGLDAEENLSCLHGQWAPGRKNDHWDLMRAPDHFTLDIARTLHHQEDELTEELRKYLDMQFGAVNKRVDDVAETVAGWVPDSKRRKRSFVGRIGDKLGVTR